MKLFVHGFHLQGGLFGFEKWHVRHWVSVSSLKEVLLDDDVLAPGESGSRLLVVQKWRRGEAEDTDADRVR